MTEQRPEDNNQTPTDEPGGVWVDNSASGLTDEPGGVWVDPPGIDPDRLGAMIREQDGVTDHGGDVQEEPNVGGVPQPGSAEQQIHSLNLSSAYEEATPPNPTFDSAYDQIIPTAPGDPIDSAYDQTVPQDPIWNTAEGDQLPNANEEALQGADKQALLLQQQKHLKQQERILEGMTKDDTSDGLDLSSAYEEVSRGDSIIDSAYDQTVPQDPIWNTAEGDQLPHIINLIPDYEFEAPVGSPDYESPDDFESPYGESQEHPGPNIPDLVQQTAPPLQFGDTVNLHNALGASLFDPAAPGPTLDPSLFDSNLPGATLDPSLFDLSAPGPSLDPALLDPNSPGPTIHPNLFDPSAPGETIDLALLDPSAAGPTLDPAQLEHGSAEPSGGIAEPAGYTYPTLTDVPTLADPGTAGQDDRGNDDFFEGV